jgi:beta-mannosidase
MVLEHGRLVEFAPGQGERAGAFRSDFDDSAWLDVRLPVDVHTALLDAGRIADLYDEQAVAWVAEREWWYRCAFDAMEDGRLVCHGLDTDVTLWLNGELLGEHHSMFRPAEFDVPAGTNVLALRFANVVDAGTDVSDVAVRDSVRLRRRKMQVAFGWDISCVLLTVGVWQPIELRKGPAPTPLAFTTLHVGDERAVVRIAGDAGASYELVAPDGELVARGTLEGGVAYAVVGQPQLWWTHDLGTPSLYELTVGGRTTRVGIRTIALDESPDLAESPSRFFRFVLNGVPVFARGANWVPEDLRLGVVSDAACRERLAQAAAANMNMIRVWGGGTYERDAFYEACDELGLLIWHDFMFACLPYPDDECFLAECEAEARYQVARLRTHPSLALWCGNNEAPADGALFADVLPRVVADEGSVPYWPASPYGGPLEGDTHDWRGFHGTDADGTADRSGAGRHWRRYSSDAGRFVSEFGFASAATAATIERWGGSEDRIRYVPGDSLVALFDATTGQPQSAAEWIDFSHLIQAEGLRFGIERFRERKPHCSGALLWQLNDCWPGFTWSIVDFDGRPKPAYYAVRRAFAPAIVTVAPHEGGQFELWLVNDSRDVVDDVIALRIQRFDGTVLSEQRFPIRVAGNAPAQLVRRFGWGRILQPRSTYVTVESERGSFAPNHQLFADFRELELPPVEVTIATDPVDAGTVEVTLTADAFAPMVALDHPQAELVFDDNYVTLHPHRPRTIRARHPHDAVDPDWFEARTLFTLREALTRS